MAVNVTSKASQVMFSAAAAQGITPRTVATWSSQIPRTPRVLVPIQLDALVLRPNGTQQTVWADCRMKDPPTGATTANRRDLLPPPFTDKDGTRPPGVYLHWALPDALTHGQGSGSDVTFPAIPDRWLVVRMYPSGLINERRAIEGWVLRAGDYPADGSLPTPIPLSKWTETGPNATSTDEITAMGRGDAAWAAYYDNVENRLGFYDPLSDIRQGPLAYLVCGWYSNTDKDPLSAVGVTSLSDFYATMAAYQWKLEDNELEQCQSKSWQYISAATQLGLQTREAVAVGAYKAPVVGNPTPPVAVTNNAAAPRADAVNPTLPGAGINAQSWTPSPAAEAGWQPAALDPSGHPLGGEYITNGSWWPELTLYHGAVVGIGWPTIGWEGMPNGILAGYLQDGVAEGEFGGPPKASDINVMVGTTQTDALASLVAKARNNPDEARMLEAFILGSLSDFDQPDGPARTDALLQASAFFSRDGGSEPEQIWIPAQPAINPPTPTAPAPANAGIFSNEAVIAQRATTAKSNAKTIQGATPKFVDRAVATTTATSTAAETIGHVYTLGAKAANFSEVSATADMQDILGTLYRKNFTPPVQTPGHYETVQRALPRLFQPSDPVILIQGGARSFRHGKDGRYNSDGTLSCRLTGFTLTELACRANGTPIRPSVKGDDLLMSGIENGSVPPECQDLLLETVLLDPGASVVAAQQSQWMINGVREVTQPVASAAATTTVPMATQQLANNFAVEQTAWWSTRDPRVDHGPLLVNSGYVGTLPSAVAVTMPRQPWAPIHLDWEVQYVPSTNGVDDWTLDENDFIPNLNNLPSSDAIAQGVTLKGRAHLTAGIADTVAAAVRQSLTQAALSGGSGSIDPGKREAFLSQYSQTILNKVQTMSLQFKVDTTASTTTGTTGTTGSISQIDRSELDDIASALENMDVLCGALDAFHQQLRGGIVGDGITKLDQGQSVPNPFFPMRAGFLRVVRLRLVDGFGQVLDLAGSGDQIPVNDALINASIPIELDNHPNLQLLPPRFTSPSRLWLRFSDATGASNADGTAAQANSSVSPICGFVLPNHLDGALEFFDTNGQNQGVLRPDAIAGIVWEDAPGLPSTVGQTPERAISSQFSAGIARGLLDWGTADADLGEGAREDALSAFLRIIDSTLWSVDPFGHHGDEHLSLLIGHPVAVVRASVRLEVQEPITPDIVNKIALPLRLGALKHWQDGLLGYFINDDYRTFYCSDATIAGFAREVGPGQGFLQQINSVEDYYQQFADDLGTDVTEGSSATPPAQGRAPVNHPYVNDSGVMTIRPNQEVRLTLLVEPQALVHGTSGLLPRKDIGFRRSWIATGLANISPTFRFGPVLVDPKTIKMPVAVESFGAWSWDHRTTITNWAEDKVVNATQDAILPIDPVTGSEGWLRLSPTPPAAPGTTGEQNQE